MKKSVTALANLVTDLERPGPESGLKKSPSSGGTANQMHNSLPDITALSVSEQAELDQEDRDQQVRRQAFGH